jgi:hypothetical protein
MQSHLEIHYLLFLLTTRCGPALISTTRRTRESRATAEWVLSCRSHEITVYGRHKDEPEVTMMQFMIKAEWYIEVCPDSGTQIGFQRFKYRTPFFAQRELSASSRSCYSPSSWLSLQPQSYQQHQPNPSALQHSPVAKRNLALTNTHRPTDTIAMANPCATSTLPRS